MDRTLKNTLWATASCCAMACGCLSWGVFSILKPWTPPERSLDGQPISKVLAIKVFPLDDGNLIVWDTDGNLSRFSVEQDRRVWLHKPKAKLIDVDVRGKSVATLKVSGKVTALDTLDGRPRQEIQIKEPVDEFHSPSAIRLSPDGTQIALTDRDNHLRTWNVESGRELANVALKDVWRSRVLEVDSAGLIYCSGESGDISFIYNPATKSLRTIKGYTQVKKLKNDSIVAVKGENQLVLELPNNSELWETRLTTAIWSFRVNPDETLATVSMPGGMPWLGGRTALVDLQGGKILMELNHPDSPMDNLEWVHGLKIVGGHDGLVLVYGRESDPVAVLRGAGADIEQLLVMSSYLYAVDKSGKCYRWKLADIQKVSD